MSSGWQGWRDWSAGDRVVVRRRLPAGAPTGHLYTDVLGVVLAVDDDGVTLRPDPARARPGTPPPEPVRVPAHEIALAKRVPPRPGRRS